MQSCMPSSWLQRSSDSLARSVFLRVGFLKPFSLFFFSVRGSFPFSLFLCLFPRRFVFKQRLTASRLRWIRTVLLRLRVVNQPPRLDHFPHHRPPLLRYYRRPLRSSSQRRLCHRLFPKHFSSRSLCCWRLYGRTEPQILPAVRLAIPKRHLPR